MPEPTLVSRCKLCGCPVSKRNTSGFCHRNPECKRKGLAVANARYHEAHPEKRAAAWAAYSPGYKERRAELDRARYGEAKTAHHRQGRSYEERLAAVQAFRTDPANAERVREYNRRGRQRYMARPDRPCLSPDGCSEYAKVGSKYCPEHRRIEANRHYHRTTAEQKQVLAERQEWVCSWCSDYLPPTLARTHIDHIIPRAIIPVEEDWNLQLLHGRCNQEKSDRITPQAIALAAAHGLLLAAQGLTSYPGPEVQVEPCAVAELEGADALGRVKQRALDVSQFPVVGR